MIQHHLSICRPDYPETVPEIERGLYVDDLLLGGQTVEKAREIKDTAREIFGKAFFQLHKWNSNAREIEVTDAVDDESGVTCAKEQLGVKPGECGLLRLRWNKDADTIAVTFPQEVAAPTKRGVLGKVVKVCDPLGLAAPLTLVGKLIYRDAFSDNGRTFIGAAHWLKEIKKDEQLQSYLVEERITWRFNLSRAPWWGRQFERLVGVFRRAFYKTIRGGMLSWTELCELVLKVEPQLNRCPLSYVEQDVQLPLLTPASFLF